ncbi:uncharacterized protein F4822DRAFT_302901 [Hypoxylon trugodes]|uniref:uncharacterized protein n=1 Tax=Hypoxylon trugodes TaxID=326681 RepID=UPI0021A1D609|nr:uncharacterized protein F4822DRAFT_302901 [Hypoxylon trugodes]KAI1388122.1 hypothetical protein F4822DRAFT_302901 [Hypoxylon trugodes]
MATQLNADGARTLMVTLRYQPGLGFESVADLNDFADVDITNRSESSILSDAGTNNDSDVEEIGRGSGRNIFHPFTRLPAELQRVIWEDVAASTRRIVTVDVSNGRATIIAADVFSLLAVNRQATALLARSYHQIPNGCLYPYSQRGNRMVMAPRVSFEHDVFLIEGGDVDMIVNGVVADAAELINLRGTTNSGIIRPFRPLPIVYSIRRFAFNDIDLLFPGGIGGTAGLQLLLWTLEADEVYTRDVHGQLWNRIGSEEIEDFDERHRRYYRRRDWWLDLTYDTIEPFRIVGRDDDADLVEAWVDSVIAYSISMDT